MASHRRLRAAGTLRAARVTVLSAAGAAAALPAAAEPADGAPAAGRVESLYAEAERAVEEYNAVAEQVAELSGEVERHRDRLARGQQDINRERRTLGSEAAAQYRSGGVSPALALLLSADPDAYLDRAAALDRVGEQRAERLLRLQRAHQAAARRRDQAAAALGELEELRARLARSKDEVRRKLAAAQREYHRMSAAPRDGGERASRDAARPAAGFPSPDSLSPRAAAAVRAARGAVGKPYVWGQNGPHGFDCSGLIQWAYAQAGTSLPRTSQAQAGAGRAVPLDQARPGDIVVYRSDASHVGMYVGDGQVVHSPYPGAAVRYDPVGMMPVSSVVRP